MSPRKSLLLFGVMLVCTAVAIGQSSGNFSATYFPAACAINNNNGTISVTGGACVGNSNTPGCEVLDSYISTSNGSGVTLLITPSAVTGLYTDTKVSNTVTTSSAQIGLQVCVQVDGSGAGVVKGGDANGCVIFDERLQQVSQNFLAGVSQVATCSTTAGANNTCFLDFLQATLSAHSYNLIAQIPGGNNHHVTATWSIVDANAGPGGTIGACVGPGNITITQTKVFNNSGAVVQE